MVSIPLLIAAAVVLILGISIASIAYMLYIKWLVLSGRKGEEAKWAADLVNEGDETFIEAMRNTPRQVMAIYGSKAESKEELRELVVEGYEQAESNRNA